MFMIQQLLYASTVAVNPSEADIEAILEQARRNNQILNVTGFMLFDGAQFLQLLEGDTQAVSALFERIKTDRRHRDIQPLLSQRARQHAFSNWSMAYAATLPDSIRRFGGSMSPVAAREMLGYLKSGDSSMRKLIADFLSDMLGVQ